MPARLPKALSPFSGSNEGYVMDFDVKLFLCALGLAFVLESALYAFFPDFMRRMLTNMLRMPVQTLRVWGLCGLGIGLCIVWIGRML